MVNATAISLERHSPDMPSPNEMMRVYNALENMSRRLGEVAPTFFSADDGVGRGQYRKFGGAFHKKVLDCRMVGYRSFGLAKTPPDSDTPAYDSFVELGFYTAPEANKLMVSIVCSQPYIQCGSSECDAIVTELAKLWPWDYGFGFERPEETMPGIYLAGGISDLQSEEDKRRVNLWCDAGHDFYMDVDPPRPLVAVRDIFPYNVIGPGHLARRLPGDMTLEQFIKGDPDSELRALSHNLWMWKVDKDRTESVRDKLRGTGVVISE